MTDEQLTYMAIGYLVLAGEIKLADNYNAKLQEAVKKLREEGFKLDGGFVA